MSRLRCLVFALATAFVVASGVPVRAASPAATATSSFWFAGTRLMFDRPQQRAGALAVGSDDFGLGKFLTKLGATLAYQPGQNFVIVTSGDRRTITFTLGDERYSVDGVPQTAPFAPYVSGGVAFVPFLALARALYVDPVDDGTLIVLQPQIGALDVRNEGRATVLTFHGASPLRFRRLSEAGDERVALTFLGIASTLERERAIAGSGLKGVSIVTGGTPKNPITIADFDAFAGSAHVLVPSDSPNTLAIAFAPPGTTLTGSAIPANGGSNVASTPLAVREGRATPQPAASDAGSAPGAAATPTALGLPVASITGFTTDDTGTGLGVRLKIAGRVTYEWHRLPDNRWYVDLKPAVLTIPAQDLPLQNSAVQSLRIKSFVGPNDRLQTVRIALSLTSPRIVTLVPDDAGVTLAVDGLDDSGGVRVGHGELSDGKILASIVPVPAPPAPDQTPDPQATWKFSPPPGSPAAPATRAKLIVIDPGHGGSDAGAARNGLTEKDLNLDLSKRLRTILVARGWQVKLTRESDVDVYAPNDSAHDELQARDDVANGLGARLFISMHTNSFTASGLNGTTTYYYTAHSYPLAQAVHARLAMDLPTKDDGIRKENFYVIHHATMPSVLIETAFLSNPGDAELLKSAAFLQKIALSIADGVGDYASSSSPLSSAATSTDGQ